MENVTASHAYVGYISRRVVVVNNVGQQRGAADTGRVASRALRLKANAVNLIRKVHTTPFYDNRHYP